MLKRPFLLTFPSNYFLMKKILIFLFVFMNAELFAQFGVLNDYQFNYLGINPAFAGENGPFTVKGLVGNQFNGNLRFNQLNHLLVLDGQLYNKFGLAFQSSSDNYGTGVGNTLNLMLSKGIEMGDLQIKAGLSGGVNLLPNAIGLGNSGTKADFILGAGLFTYYNGAFAGVSQPVLFTGKNSFNGKSPLLVNVGYTSPDDENFLTYNANILAGIRAGKYNYDFNLKFWLNKRMGLGGSYRINHIYTSFSKEKAFVPSIEYKFTEDLILGLGYNPNTLRLSNTTNPNSQFSLNGLFQFYIRYNKEDKKGDSWYYEQF